MVEGTRHVNEAGGTVSVNETGADRTLDVRQAADVLFGSPTSVDLLIQFCRNPDRRFYVNELIKLTGRFPRSVQLALSKLERVGILQSERLANARYYAMNSEHPFFADVLSLVRKIPDGDSALLQSLRKVEGIRVAYRRFEEEPAGDLELVVMGEVQRRAVEDAIEPVAVRLQQRVRLECFASEEWRRLAHRERSIVQWLLEGPRRFILGSEAELSALTAGR